MRILVIKGGALGDFILCLPLLEVLAQAGAALDVVGPGRWLPLVEGLCSQVFDLERPPWDRLYTRAPPPLPYDAAVVLRPDPDGLLRRHLREAGVAQVWQREPLPEPGWAGHMVDHNLAAWPGITSGAADRTPRLRLKALEREGAAAALRSQGLVPGRFVVLQPGSGGLAKRWPPSCWQELARRLSERSVPWVVSLGPIEGERGEGADWAGARIWAELPLRGLAALASHAALVVGSDSGTTHLAAAAGGRVLALFGPTDPDRWRPLGEGVQVLRAPQPTTMASLSVEQVARVVWRHLGLAGQGDFDSSFHEA